MRKRIRAAAALVTVLVLAPVLVAGRPACCKPPSAPVASRGCCPAMAGAQTSVPKGCCKAPVAPRNDANAKDVAQITLSIPVTLGAPAMASAALPDAVQVRLARHAYHAVLPDDSPPDLLSHLRILLI